MSTPTPPPHSHFPKFSLLTSLLAYPILFSLVSPLRAPSTGMTKSREAISVLHCTLITLVSLYELRSRSREWNVNVTTSSHDYKENNLDYSSKNLVYAYGAHAPLITTRSTLGNSITAFELGYLVQDSVILILAAQSRAREKSGRRLIKEINWRVLGWHHVGISSALAVLQWYIARGKEKGIMVIVMLMLMNATTPIGTLHWYLVNFQPWRKKAIMFTNAIYLVMYGIFRVALVGWILHVMGSQTGESALGAFLRLRMSCRLGTATIGMANLMWFVLGVRKFARRFRDQGGNGNVRKGKGR